MVGSDKCYYEMFKGKSKQVLVGRGGQASDGG